MFPLHTPSAATVHNKMLISTHGHGRKNRVLQVLLSCKQSSHGLHVLKMPSELKPLPASAAYLLPDVFCPASDLDHEAHIFCPDQTGSGLLSYCRHHSPDAARHLAGSWLRTRQKRASFFSVNASLLQSHHKVPPRCQ